MNQEPRDRLTRTRPTREELQLSRLQDWISRPFWTATEAAYLLVGVTPETRHHDQQGWDFEFLPGGRRAEWLNSDGSTRSLTFTGNFESELEGAKKLTFYEGKTAIKSPREWIEHAVKWKCDPPWLSTARSDEECREFVLPLETLAQQPPPLVADLPQRLGGKAKFKSSSSNRVQQQIQLCLLEWLKNPACYSHREDFVADMYAKFHDPDAPLEMATFDDKGESPRVRRRPTIKKHIDKLIDVHGLPSSAK